MRTELNAKDTDIDNIQANQTGSVTMLNGIAPGTGISQRIGRKIVIRSVYIRGHSRTGVAQTVPQLARMILVWDKQPNSVLATTDQILTTINARSQLNLDNRDRFSILADWQRTIADTDGGTQGYPIKLYKKCNLVTVYDGDDALIDSISSGALLLVLVGDQPTGTNTNPVFYLTVRVRYNPL